MTTALDLIEAAYRKIHVLGTGQSLTNEEAQDGLFALNNMLDQWSIEGDLVYTETRENFNLVAGTASYTIGSGQTFNTTRPVEIVAAFVRSGNDDTNLTIIDQRDYAAIIDKAAQGTPASLYYDAGYATGTIFLSPVPNAANALYIYSKKVLSNIATLQTTVTLPPGYNAAIIDNLSVVSAPSFEREASPTVKSQATYGRRIIKNANTRTDTNTRTIDQTLTRRLPYDIISGR